MLACHAILRLRDHRVMAPTAAARRVLARVVLRTVDPLLAFRCADTHLHMVVMADLAVVLEQCRRVEIALQHRLKPGVPFERAWVEPVRSQRHLYNAFRYAFRQEQHHGTALDPFHDASNLSDLLGLRVLGARTREVVRVQLPRLERAELVEWFGTDPFAGGLWVESQGFPATVIADASAAALGLADTRGRTADARRARASAAKISAAEGRSTLAECLGIGPTTLGRSKRADHAVDHALRLQLAARWAYANAENASPWASATAL